MGGANHHLSALLTTSSIPIRQGISQQHFTHQPHNDDEVGDALGQAVMFEGWQMQLSTCQGLHCSPGTAQVWDFWFNVQ